MVIDSIILKFLLLFLRQEVRLGFNFLENVD